MTFLDTARELLGDEHAKAAFARDPQGFLAERGFGDLDAADLADAVGFVAESLPVGVARQVLPEHPEDGLDGPELLGRLAAADPGLDLDDPGGLDDLPPLAAAAAVEPTVDALTDTDDADAAEPVEADADPADLAFGAGESEPATADDASPAEPASWHDPAPAVEAVDPGMDLDAPDAADLPAEAYEVGASGVEEVDEVDPHADADVDLDG
jgi:hypothetical protein